MSTQRVRFGSCLQAALREEDGGLYTSVKNGQDETLRLLVDTGAARSVLSSRHHGNVVAAELDCPSLGLTGLDCAVADLPSDVDGIIGFDAMRGFAATELDLSSGRLRLHNRAYSATHDEGGRGVSGREGMSRAELTRTPRGLRRVRTGYAYQPPALGTYRRRRAACPQGPTYCTYWVRVPASAVPYVPRTVWQPRWSTGSSRVSRARSSPSKWRWRSVCARSPVGASTCALSRWTPRSTRGGWRRASLGPPYGPRADAYFIRYGLTCPETWGLRYGRPSWVPVDPS